MVKKIKWWNKKSVFIIFIFWGIGNYSLGNTETKAIKDSKATAAGAKTGEATAAAASASASLSLVADNKVSSKVKTINLKTVAQLVLNQSLKKEESVLNYQQAIYKKNQSLASLDYTLNVESGWEQSKFENFTGTANPKDETYKTNIQLKKTFLTGTNLILEYTRTSLKSEFASSYTGSLPNSQTQDVVGLSLEQSLLKNILGQNTQRDLELSELDVQQAEKNKLLQMQEQVLEAIRAFWKAYVSQKNFLESISTRDRYLKLVESVRKKNQFGYANPGELYQVLAELEIREQTVKSLSQDYLNSLDCLLTLLNMPKEEKIELIIPEGLTPAPVLSKLNLETNRSLLIQKDKIKQSEVQLETANNKTLPDLSLVGKVYRSGLEPTSEDAFTEMSTGSHPKYYLGFKFSYSFGSDQQKDDYKSKLIQKNIEHLKFNKLQSELLEKESVIQRKIQVSYNSIISLKSQLEWREKALQDIQKAYTQGRLDISQLIDSMNKYFAVQTQYTQSLGDYQIALNEWSALSDQLVTTYGSE